MATPVTFDVVHPKRICGGCTACCIAPAIEPLNKPCGERCTYLGAKGCSVYHDRTRDPKFAQCISFRCLWLQGWLDEQDRPDKLGVVFAAVAEPDIPGKMRLQIVEMEPGKSSQNSRVQHLIAQVLAQGMNVMVSNRYFAIGHRPSGDSWKFQIDPADPLHLRPDPMTPPTQLTVAGKIIPH